MFKLEQGEHLVLTARKHWLVFLLQNAGFIIAAILPFVILGFMEARITPYLISRGLDSGEASSLIFFSVFAWELLILCVFAVSLTNYYLDIVFVTNKRIIDIDQRGLFARDLAIMPIEQMQDIKIQVFGILATLFGFGTLSIQTAGTEREIIIRGLRDPQGAKDIILSAYHKNKHTPQ